MRANLASERAVCLCSVFKWSPCKLHLSLQAMLLCYLFLGVNNTHCAHTIKIPSQYVNNNYNSVYIAPLIVHVMLTQYCAGDKIEKNEMGWACGAYG